MLLIFDLYLHFVTNISNYWYWNFCHTILYKFQIPIHIRNNDPVQNSNNNNKNSNNNNDDNTTTTTTNNNNNNNNNNDDDLNNNILKYYWKISKHDILCSHYFVGALCPRCYMPPKVKKSCYEIMTDHK